MFSIALHFPETPAADEAGVQLTLPSPCNEEGVP